MAETRFPVRAAFLVTLGVVFAFMSGAFMYATGGQVVQNAYMSMVSHTEYRYAEAGQIIARIVDFKGDPVSVNSCNATILYPNKTTFVNMAGMTATGIGGDFYYNFTTPSGPEGVYEYQATCFYNPSKNASVTNSFHLSSALSTIQGNISLIQGNLTLISQQINATNASLSGQISALSASMGGNFSVVQSNFSQVLAAIAAINASTVNFTPVLDGLNNLNTSLAGNFSVIINNQVQINTTANNIYSLLQVVNTTTTNTYAYVTGTLTLKIDDALTQLGIINATVNRIETNTVAINDTVNAIRTNQENAVVMSISSG